MAAERIEHEGKVVSISENYIGVEIVSKSACAACHAKGVCAASDEAVKVIEVPYDIATLSADYKIGDCVNVVLSSSLGVRAIWLRMSFRLLFCLHAFLSSHVRAWKSCISDSVRWVWLPCIMRCWHCSEINFPKYSHLQ